MEQEPDPARAREFKAGFLALQGRSSRGRVMLGEGTARAEALEREGGRGSTVGLSPGAVLRMGTQRAVEDANG